MDVRWKLSWYGDELTCPDCGAVIIGTEDGTTYHLPELCPNCGAVNVGVEIYDENGYYKGLKPAN